MADYTLGTEDDKGRQIKPVLTNTAKDGSGTFLFPLVDADGHPQVDILANATGVYTTNTFAAVTVGTVSTALLAANTSRVYTLFINNSNEPVYMKFGSTAVVNEGIVILNSSGVADGYEMSKQRGNLWVGAVNAICTTGGKVVLTVQGT